MKRTGPLNPIPAPLPPPTDRELADRVGITVEEFKKLKMDALVREESRKLQQAQKQDIDL